MADITQNGVLKRDDNDTAVMGGTSSVDNATIINAAFDPVTRRLLTDSSSGSGTVTSVSVVTANGFAGTVATATTTPAITLTTTITGVLKGNGTAISAATAGTDYQAPITLTTTGTSGAATFIANTLNIPNYATSGGLTVGTTTITSGTTTRILYDNAGVLGEYTLTGSGTVVAMATAPTFVTSITTPSVLATSNGSGSLGASGTAFSNLFLASTGTINWAAGNVVLTHSTGILTLTAGELRITSANVGTNADSVPTLSSTSTFTNKTLTSPTLTTPVINGTATGTGVSATPTASIIAMWDANKGLSATNFIPQFTTTATAAGTTTMTIASTQTQVWTGSSTQTVKLPTTSVLQGTQYYIINQSTGAVTVQSSGANTITILAAGTSATFTAVVATPTTAANWNSQYFGDIVASGKSLSVSNTLTLAGTDATTMTFPTTSATIARTDAAQTFTGVQTFSSAPVLSTGTLTSVAALQTFPSTAQTLVGRTSTDTLTNKRITRRTASTAGPGATPTTNSDNVDYQVFTALAANITSMSTNLSGTPVAGDFLEFWLTDNGTARTITWGASFAATTVALPTTTVISTKLRVLFEYGGSTWDCVAVA